MRYVASSANTTAGTPSGSVSNTSAQDDLLYSITEDNAVGITSVFTIASSALSLLPDFLRVYGWYVGSGGHYITVSAYNFNTLSYVDIGRMQGGSAREYLFSLGSADYHDPATGEMRFRFLHSPTTYNPSHSLNINSLWVDKVALGAALAPGSITRETFAPGAVDAAALASDAVQEIQAGLATDDILTTLPGVVRASSGQSLGHIPPVPTVSGTDLVLYRGASYETILFTLSTEWIPYLQSEDPLYEIVFSAKRFYTDDDTKLLWSIPCSVVDAEKGTVSATMTRTQTNHRIKTGLWQISIRLVDENTGEVVFARPAKEGRLILQALVKTT